MSYLPFFCLVAKRKSLFDDKPIEIQELTYIIKQDIKSLNDKIAQLQTVRGFVYIQQTCYQTLEWNIITLARF